MHFNVAQLGFYKCMYFEKYYMSCNRVNILINRRIHLYNCITNKNILIKHCLISYFDSNNLYFNAYINLFYFTFILLSSWCLFICSKHKWGIYIILWHFSFIYFYFDLIILLFCVGGFSSMTRVTMIKEKNMEKYRLFYYFKI